ncbi:MFS transporter [Solirubrobacter soli]|uniref:MFS transporter n=1 Tax=Solirubrobacter soli TaxID=363832 RepID=UPI0004286E44|nr:MFS transporter [Solirubrobacter soli]
MTGNTRQLTLALVAFTVTFYGWALLGPLGPDLQDDLGLTDVQLSIAVAVPVLLGSLMRIPMGVLSERFGGRRVFTWLLVYTILPLVALGFVHDSFGAIIALGFLLGFAGASFAIGVPFVNRWYPPERQGAALGIYGAGMGGTVLAGLTAPRLGSVSAAFFLAAGLVAIVLVIWVLFARDAPGPPSNASMRDPIAVLGTGVRAWALVLFYFLAFGGFVAMYLYLPKLLTGVHDLTKTDAGARAAGFALLAVIGRPLGGVLSDRIGAERVLRVCFVGVLVLALGLAAGYKSIVPLTICCLVMAAGLGLGMGAVFKLVPVWYPENVGAVTGVVGAAGGLGGFFPPLVMGFVKSATGGYALGFILLALVALACLVMLTRLRA